MSSLIKALGLNIGSTNMVLIGVPELSNKISRSGDKEEPYYVCQLKTPAIVRCSVDSGITPFETSEVYIRESALAEEGWEFVNPAKPEEGFFIKGWTLDFSPNQEIAVYQAESISAWRRGNRQAERISKTAGINERLKARIAAQK